MMNEKKIDELLSHGLVQAPDDFRNRVMQQVAEHERSRLGVPQESAPLTWWQWSAVILGTVLGIGQVLRFIFAVWLVTAAG